jgi:long-chain acyl-CoA synthetase
MEMMSGAPTSSLAELRKNDPKNAVHMWKRRVAATPDAIAYRYHDGGGWRTMTFGEADVAAEEIAAGLAARGVVPGDRVCLVSQTRLEWVLCDLGVLLAGGATVPIYSSNTAEQSEFIIRDAGAKLVIVEDAVQRDKLLALCRQIAGVACMIQMTGDVAGPAGFVEGLPDLRTAGKAWAAGHSGELVRRAEAIDPAAMSTIIYTSGTTGVPKGVILTHDNLVAGVCSAIRAMGVYPSDEQYLFLPLAHVLGRELEWCGIESGFPTSFSRGTALIKEDLAVIRPTFMAGVPRIFEKFYAGVTSALAQGSGLKRKLASWALAAGAARAAALGRGEPAPSAWLADKLVLSKLRARLGLDRCRFLVSGGAPLAAEIAEFFLSTGILILEGYGLTETMAAAHLNVHAKFRFGTVGPALDVVETKIADDGEILMRGPSVFREYYNNPAATAESVEPEGWFHSGDIGVIEDGFLRITDRKKDLIVTAGGKKSAPQPIENAIKATSRLVSQVVVYGDKRPYCVALVTLSDEATKRFGNGVSDGAAMAASAEVRAALQKDIDVVNAKLASFEAIKRFAILPQDLTEASGDLTPKLSVKRKVVTEKYKSVIEELYR